MRLFLLYFLFLSTACSHMQVDRSDVISSSTESYTIQLSSFLFSLVPARTLDANKDLCPNSRLERLDLKMSTSDVLLTLVTVGIYVRHQVTITCAKQLAEVEK